MADITMCKNEDRKLKNTCYRYKALPNPNAQAYGGFEPRADGTCKYYWKMR